MAFGSGGGLVMHALSASAIKTAETAERCFIPFPFNSLAIGRGEERARTLLQTNYKRSFIDRPARQLDSARHVCPAEKVASSNACCAG